MNLYSLFLILLTSSVSSVYSHTFSLCDSETFLNISSVDLIPDPPQVGKNLNVNIQFISSQDILSGNAELEIKAWGATLTTLNFDVCKDASLTCPLKKNTNYILKLEKQIPSFAPAIKVDTITKISTNNNEIGCVELTTTLSKSYFRTYFF